MNIKIIGGIISVLIIIVVITLYFLRRNKTEEESETDVVDGEDAETDVVDGEDDDSDGEDDESGVVDEESGLVDEESGLVDEENQPDQQISLDAETDQLTEEERAAEEAAAEQAAEEQARLDEEAAEEQARLDEEAAEEQARLDEEARLAEELAELERIRIAEALLLKMAGANPIAHYVAETYTNNQIWNNSIVGITLDATEWKGNSTVESHTNNGKSFKAIKFEQNDGVRFDSSISAPNYTVITVGRRRSSGGRVINGTTGNVLHGWHGNQTGVFYQGGWMQPKVNSGHGDQWCIMAATNSGLAYVNGKLVHDLNNYSGTTPAQWSINYGQYQGTEWSQSDIAEMIFYDKHLSKEELVTENERLKTIYGIQSSIRISCNNASSNVRIAMRDIEIYDKFDQKIQLNCLNDDCISKGTQLPNNISHAFDGNLDTIFSIARADEGVRPSIELSFPAQEISKIIYYHNNGTSRYNRESMIYGLRLELYNKGSYIYNFSNRSEDMKKQYTFDDKLELTSSVPYTGQLQDL